MAFATSNVKLESDGSLWALVGDFTANVGDADGAVVVGGARVYSSSFMDGSDTTPGAGMLPVSVSTNTSTGKSTITVNVSGGVTAGRFKVVYR